MLLTIWVSAAVSPLFSSALRLRIDDVAVCMLAVIALRSDSDDATAAAFSSFVELAVRDAAVLSD
jgi:hypothetical protein